MCTSKLYFEKLVVGRIAQIQLAVDGSVEFSGGRRIADNGHDGPVQVVLVGQHLRHAGQYVGVSIFRIADE